MYNNCNIFLNKPKSCCRNIQNLNCKAKVHTNRIFVNIFKEVEYQRITYQKKKSEFQEIPKWDTNYMLKENYP